MWLTLYLVIGMIFMTPPAINEYKRGPYAKGDVFVAYIITVLIWPLAFFV